MADLAEAVRKSRLDGLRSLADTLASAIEADRKGVLTASLARQLREVLAEVDQLERAGPREGSIVDELADRRKTRGADAPRPTPAGRRRAGS